MRNLDQSNFASDSCSNRNMSKIIQVFGILLMCQIFVKCEREYYCKSWRIYYSRQNEKFKIFTAPDETVHQNLRNVDPISYLLPFKEVKSDDEFLRLSKKARSTGPVHTYVKTDKHANVKWGVRHFVGKKYAWDLRKINKCKFLFIKINSSFLNWHNFPLQLFRHSFAAFIFSLLRDFKVLIKGFEYF